MSLVIKAPDRELTFGMPGLHKYFNNLKWFARHGHCQNEQCQRYMFHLVSSTQHRYYTCKFCGISMPAKVSYIAESMCLLP